MIFTGGLFDLIYDPIELQFPSTGVPLSHDRLRPYVIFNMVTSLDGKARAEASTPTDRRVMGHLRNSVDGVLWGGGTIRADEFAFRLPPVEGRDQSPWGIVWSQSGNLPFNHPLWEGSPARRLIVVDPSTPLATQTSLDTLAPTITAANPTELLTQLWRDYQIKTLLVEGGPILNQLLIEQGIGEELFLTVSPLLLGGGYASILAGKTLSGGQPMELRSVKTHGSELYLRYQFSQGYPKG